MNTDIDPVSGLPDLRFDNPRMLIACLDLDLRFVQVNQTYADAAGRSDPAWFVGQGHFDLYPHRENEEIFRRVLHTGEQFDVSGKPFEHPDQPDRGTTFWDWSLVPWRDDRGVVRGLVFYVLDVTERERARHDRDAAEARFRELINALPDGVCILREGRVVFASPALLEFLQVDEVELLGTRFADRFFRDEQPALAELLTHPGERELHLTVDATRVACARSQLLDFDGRPAVLLTLRDVTDQRRLERTLERAARLESLGRLAGGIAHDFNNLLLVIGATAKLLSLERADDAEMLADLEEIVGAGERAAGLTQQLLAFGQRQTLQPRRLDVNVLLTSLSGFFRRALGADIELVLELYDGPVPIEVDPDRFEQVITNLLLNARNAMPRGGKVVVSTSLVGAPPAHPDLGGIAERWALIRVRDTGTGMDKETLENIFEPFWSSRDEPEGHGLGLVSARGTIQQSRGLMDVVSELGQGAEFRIHLPCPSGPVAEGRPDRPSRVAPGARGTEVILLVDDDAQVRRTLRRTLEHYGYEVLDTTDADGARTLLERHGERIDLLLTDVVLGGESGPDLAHGLGASGALLPVVFMSGYATDLLGERSGLPDGVDLLEKPMTPAVLAARVRRAIDRAVSEAGSD